jgi:hypothetical protein
VSRCTPCKRAEFIRRLRRLDAPSGRDNYVSVHDQGVRYSEVSGGREFQTSTTHCHAPSAYFILRRAWFHGRHESSSTVG